MSTKESRWSKKAKNFSTLFEKRPLSWIFHWFLDIWTQYFSTLSFNPRLFNLRLLNHLELKNLVLKCPATFMVCNFQHQASTQDFSNPNWWLKSYAMNRTWLKSPGFKCQTTFSIPDFSTCSFNSGLLIFRLMV